MVWINPADNSTWVFVANFNGISALKVGLNGSNVPVLNQVWVSANPGTSPVIANGILFYMNNGIVRALNPLNGNQLWSDTTTGGVHWQSPIVANGTLYLTNNSSQLFAFNLNVPNAPSNLSTTTASASQINLGWQDNSTNESGFLVERKTGAGGSYSQIAQVGPNVLSYQDTGLLNGTAYYYRVRAVNSTGTSAYSNEANATTTLPAPDTLAASAKSFIEIDLSWLDHSNGESGFEIQRKVGSGGTFATIARTGSNTTTYHDIGLASNTAYYYQVRAFTSDTTSTFSAPANATTSAAANIVVMNNNDSGGGSLRQALSDAAVNQSIGFDAGVTTISLTTDELPALKSGVTLSGRCATGLEIHLVRTLRTTPDILGLTLDGNNTLFGISVAQFTGVQIAANNTGSTGANSLKCVTASKL